MLPDSLPDVEFVSAAFRDLTHLAKFNCWHIDEGESTSDVVIVSP